MKTKYLFPLCFILLHSSCCLSIHAQGTAFTYQGRLEDGGNGYALVAWCLIWQRTDLPAAIETQDALPKL